MDVYPQAGEKNGPNSQGKVVGAPPQAERAPPVRARVDFLGYRGNVDGIVVNLVVLTKVVNSGGSAPKEILATPMVLLEAGIHYRTLYVAEIDAFFYYYSLQASESSW